MSRRAVDVLVLGAGAAGLMAGIEAARRGRRVLIVDHAQSPGEKIRISGGGRCNFTNRETTPKRFISQNPKFAISALSRYGPERFIARVKARDISFHEKALGQMFCDGPATQIVALLVEDLRAAGGELKLATAVEAAEQRDAGFTVRLSSEVVEAASLVVATGGKSIPKMGATGLAYRLAAQFGLAVVPTRPGLVPLTFSPDLLAGLAPLAGVSLPVTAAAAGTRFAEALLFTHRGLSGPAILQISSYWREGDAIEVDLLPQDDVLAMLKAGRNDRPRLALQTLLAAKLPKRLAQAIADDLNLPGMIGDFSDQKLGLVAARMNRWTLKPTGTEGYRTAEVTLGGIDTAGLDSTTMAAKTMPGLYFIGEAVDVTGWLGGYNLQWAWASGWAAGQYA